jgi:hypothetical protein
MARGSTRFTHVLLTELKPMLAVHPLLAAATDQGGRVDPASLQLSLISADPTQTRLRIGVFGSENVGGCSCADEPHTARFYVELALRLDPAAGTAEIRAATG